MNKILLFILFLIPLNLKGQSPIGVDNFDWEIRRGVVAVEFLGRME